MTPERFKEISRIVRSNPVFNDLPEDELMTYWEMQERNHELADWELTEMIRDSGFEIEAHCCTSMRFHLIEQLKEQRQLETDPAYINYDSVIVFDQGRDSYGLPIYDGGSSYVRINFCPWCGGLLSMPSGSGTSK